MCEDTELTDVGPGPVPDTRLVEGPLPSVATPAPANRIRCFYLFPALHGVGVTSHFSQFTVTSVASDSGSQSSSGSDDTSGAATASSALSALVAAAAVMFVFMIGRL
jgi:hypothetical protein